DGGADRPDVGDADGSPLGPAHAGPAHRRDPRRARLQRRSDQLAPREGGRGVTTESLVTPDMVERQGQWSEPRSSYPVGQSDIRRWAIATYWPEKPPPIFWDEEYARSTRWGGIIAPPDFNPFA